MSRLALAAVLAGLALASCTGRPKSVETTAIEAVENLEKLIDRHVADEARAARAQATQRKVERTFLRFFEEVSAARDEGVRLNASYDATRDSFANIQRLLSAHRTRRAEELIRHAMEARRATTREEWRAINAGLGK
ncbi:MAG: hypothetical protein ACYTEZ_15690 [Planctomycetota bacterium]|jgi:hypothetical protein